MYRLIAPYSLLPWTAESFTQGQQLQQIPMIESTPCPETTSIMLLVETREKKDTKKIKQRQV